MGVQYLFKILFSIFWINAQKMNWGITLSFIFNFWRLSIPFSIVTAPVYNHTNIAQDSKFSTCLQRLVIFQVDGGHLHGCKVVSPVCIYLTAIDIKHLFLCLLAICVFSLEPCLFQSFACFLIEIFVGWFCYWVARILYIFWVLILYLINGLQIFLPIYILPLHSTDCFFCCAEVFKSDVVPFIYFCLCLWYHIQEIIAHSEVMKIFSYDFYRIFVVSCLTLRSLIHVKLIFLYG